MKKLIHLLLLFSTTCLSAQTYSELIDKAKSHYFKNRNDSTCFYLSKAILLDPMNPEPYVLRSLSKEMADDHYGAIADLDTAISIKNDEADFYLYRARNKKSLSDYFGALKDLDKSLVLDDSLAEAWSEKSVVLGHMDKYTEALDCISKAIELKPSKAGYYATRAFMLHVFMRKPAEAFKDQSKAYQLDREQSVRFLEIMVDMAFKGGLADSALFYCRVILDRSPENFYSAYWKIARIHEGRGLHDSALIYFNRAIAIKPQRGMYFMRSGVYVNLKKYSLALADLDKAILMDSTYAEAYIEKAAVLLEHLHDAAAALKVYNRLLEVQYDYGKAYYYRALLYYDHLKDPQRACVDIQRAIGFEYEPARYELTRICEGAGK